MHFAIDITVTYNNENSIKNRKDKNSFTSTYAESMKERNILAAEQKKLDRDIEVRKLEMEQRQLEQKESYNREQLLLQQTQLNIQQRQ